MDEERLILPSLLLSEPVTFYNLSQIIQRSVLKFSSGSVLSQRDDETTDTLVRSSH